MDLDKDLNNIPESLVYGLLNSKNTVALTGAGISAASGIPTFREALTGLWAKYDPEDLATPGAFNKDPKLVWQWYTWRRDLILNALPNPGHIALAELERLLPDFSLITQNVDGLHQKAGSGAVSRIIELHGNIHRNLCSIDKKVVDKWVDNGALPPRCPDCGGLLRPDVVWFGESLPLQALVRAQIASSECDYFLIIGTSAVVEPAASLPFLSMQNGGVLVEINPSITPLTQSAEYVLQGFSEMILPALVRRIRDLILSQ